MAPLVVVDTGITYGDDGTAYPTAVLDVSERSDVADLGRVHAIEGIGDLTTSLAITGNTALLTVAMTRPVRNEFTIAFVLPECQPLLEHAAATGSLLLATTTPSSEGDHPLWLAINIDGPRLAALLPPHSGSSMTLG